MTFTYSIFKVEKDRILPDGKLYYNEVKYHNCDYEKYFIKHPEKWIEDTESENVFFSNYENRSTIKAYSNTLVRYISNKTNLTNLLLNEPYYPTSLSFKVANSKIPYYLSKNWNPYPGSLWFLKKASDLTYGGFDVFPLRVFTKSESLREIEKLIKKSNASKKYKSDYFILQKGIENPDTFIINKLKYKYDIRAYGLFVKVNPEIPTEFYFFKRYLTRRSIKPYDPNSLDKTVMLTNTTQGKLADYDISNLTSLEDNSLIYYNKMFDVYSRLCKDYLKILEDTIVNNNICINIIGLDFIFDENTNVYLLEINKFPTIHCDEDKRHNFHHDLEDLMFNDDFFKISFESIIEGKPLKESTEYYDYVK